MFARALSVLRRAWSIFSGRGARFLGAAVAFYALASIAPLFVVVLHLVGALFGSREAERVLFANLAHWLAPDGVHAVAQLTARLDASVSSQSTAGMLLLVYASTRLFRALQRALEQLFGVDTELLDRSQSAPVRYVLRYATSLALVLLVCAQIAALAATKVGIALLARYGHAGAPRGLWALDAALSFGSAYGLIFATYRLLPRVRVRARDAALGALLSTTLFALGSVAVSAYVQHKLRVSVYGGATALVMGVLWVYYSAQVFFLGASVLAALRERIYGRVESGGARA